ncbi:ORF1 [torque teno Delphinidae virus 29]
MPYGYYRGRAGYRRGYRRTRTWYRRRWRARQQRYYSWRYRRSRRRWVRGLSYKLYNRKKRWALIRRRRRRFLRWFNRYRYRWPKPLRFFNPPFVRLCTIKGYFPLLYFTGKQISWPFIDPISHTEEGGGIAFNDFSLNKLYIENEKRFNKWSISNYGFGWARFLSARFTLYRHPLVSYMVKYFQGTAIHEHQTYMDIHPAKLMLQRKRYIMASNERVPFRKRFKKKKIRIKMPKNMTNDWYPMVNLGETILVRLGVSVTDLLHPFQSGFQTNNPGNYYFSIGYNTPDRRTLYKYKFTPHPLSNRYDTSDINTWGPIWQTWGGPINIILPYGASVGVCQNKFPELAASGVTLTTLSQEAKDVYYNLGDCATGREPADYYKDLPRNVDQFKNPETMKKFENKFPAYLFKTWRTDNPKYMSSICQCGLTVQQQTDLTLAMTQDDLHFERVIFAKLTAGLPSTSVALKEQWSFSSHRSQFVSEMKYLPFYDRQKEGASQCFWPGRYSPHYDTGKGNVVYGLYMNESMLAKSPWRHFMNGDTGPGWGIHDTFFATEPFFENQPYWLTFYGHNYKSFLSYLNELKPEIKLKSAGHIGFFAVAIRTIPAENVASGPFYNGYAPLRYLGENAEYFTSERAPPWPTYWKMETNRPPINSCNQLDTNAWIFCLLRDGRKVMYGSSMEGSLLWFPNGKDYLCTTKLWDTNDDIAVIGRSGPFVPDAMDPRISSGVTNLFARYSFKFLFGGYTPPARQLPDDLRICEPAKAIQPQPAFPETLALQSTPTKPRRPRRSKRHAEDPVYPEHPTKVSFSEYYPPRDTSPGGSITKSAWQRLTSEIPFSAHCLGLGRNGRPVDNKLFVAYSNLQRGNYPPTTSSEEEEEREPAHQIWPGLPPEVLHKETQVPYLPLPQIRPHRSRRSTQSAGDPDCISCQTRRDPQPHGRNRELVHRFGLLPERRKQLRRLMRHQHILQLLRGCDSE